jgi:hypothetical protein
VVLRRRRLLLSVALLAGGVLAGPGGPGLLLILFAVMLFLDAVLPTPGGTWGEADARFDRLVRQRRRARRLSRLLGQPPGRLDVLDDAGGWASRCQRRNLGVEAIDADSIVGTVEWSKAADFDGAFRPIRSAGERWKRIWLAQEHGVELPPISVYRIGRAHILRDGHHRVSVARDRGVPMIDAEVTELWPPAGERLPGAGEAIERGRSWAR